MSDLVELGIRFNGDALAAANDDWAGKADLAVQMAETLRQLAGPDASNQLLQGLIERLGRGG